MPLVRDLVELTRTKLYGASRPAMSKLSGAIDATQTNVSFLYPLPLQQGDTFEIEGEWFAVWSSDATSQVASPVERGWGGSEPNSHPDGAIVLARPRFPRALIMQACKEEVDTLPNDFFMVQSTTVTTTGYTA